MKIRIYHSIIRAYSLSIISARFIVRGTHSTQLSPQSLKLADPKFRLIMALREFDIFLLPPYL
jgi:hypothetical protein